MVNLSVFFAIISMFLGLSSAEDDVSKELYRCRQLCYTRFVQDWHHCMDYQECKNCWNSCDETLGPFPLNVNGGSRKGSLVLAEIAWDQAITNASKQCLVTWEVSGGGLMGNLLTDSSTVELSLWSDTVYHVQVTCKNKDTGAMRRSYKLIVDTRKVSGKSSTMQPVSLDANLKTLQDIFPTESISSETVDRLKILKDSSKDNMIHDPPIEKTPVHTPTVIRSKLSSIHTESSEFFSRSILFAMIGSLVMFLGIVLIYVLTRGREESTLDKEGLIKNEVAPGTRTLHV